MKTQEQHACSFCGKLDSETTRILQGPPGTDIAICEECVTFSKKLLSMYDSTIEIDGVCSFCGKKASQVGRLVYGPGVNICDDCIEFAQQQLDDGNPTDMIAFNSPWNRLVTRLYKLLGNRPVI
jgi:ATP-dependent protease Clp ATPase subunit